MTIAQMRYAQVEKLANMGNGDIEKAQRLMNSFYRLCGLCEKNLYLANDARTANRKSTAESEEREERWYKRLSKEFEEFAGLRLYYSGYAPSIGTVNEHGGCTEEISRIFY